MSLHAYQVSREIEAKGYPFYALIMAAMRQADTENTEKLRAAWPHVWGELYARYHAPDGRLLAEIDQEAVGG